MYLQSILITGGNDQTHQQKLQEILSLLDFPDLPNFPNHPNIALVSPDEEKTAIGIDKVREIRSWLAIKSTTSQPKVAIISHADTLTEAAQNAFLKTLEEPPENTYLILMTKNLDLLLPTVISRCQIIELPEKTNLDIPKKEFEELKTVLNWIGESNITRGFTWVKDLGSDRSQAIETLDKLLFIAHQHLLQDHLLQTASIRSLFGAKKCLQVNCNVRLTLENLFLN